MPGEIYNKNALPDHLRWEALRFGKDGVGFVDGIVRNGEDSITLAGWALLREKDRYAPASMFLVTERDNFVCCFTSRCDREDVQQAFHKDAPLGCGFHIDISAALFDAGDVRTIAVYAVAGDVVWGLSPQQNGHASTYPFWARMRTEENLAGKSYVSCHWIEHGFMIDGLNNVLLCCEADSRREHDVATQDVQNLCANFPEDFCFDTFIAKRASLRPIDNIPQNNHCLGCQSLVRKVWDEERTYKLGILNFTQYYVCDLRCSYCFLTKNNLHTARQPSYQATYDILQRFEALGAVHPRAVISLAGGEPLLAPDFDRVCRDFFLKRDRCTV